MISEYQAGLIEVVADSDLITGRGTSWLTYIKAGDQLIAAGQTYAIAEVVDVATIRLATPYTGGSGLINYRIDITQE